MAHLLYVYENILEAILEVVLVQHAHNGRAEHFLNESFLVGANAGGEVVIHLLECRKNEIFELAGGGRAILSDSPLPLRNYLHRAENFGSDQAEVFWLQNLFQRHEDCRGLDRAVNRRNAVPAQCLAAEQELRTGDLEKLFDVADPEQSRLPAYWS